MKTERTFRGRSEREHPGLKLITDLLAAPWQPAVEVQETPESVVVVAELAGVCPDDVKVESDGKHLTLKGERRCLEPDEPTLEIETGPFERRVRLPAPVDLEHRTIASRDGMIRLELPKASHQ